MGKWDVYFLNVHFPTCVSVFDVDIDGLLNRPTRRRSGGPRSEEPHFK